MPIKKLELQIYANSTSKAWGTYFRVVKKIDQKFDLSLVKVDQQRLKVKVCQFQNLNYR